MPEVDPVLGKLRQLVDEFVQCMKESESRAVVAIDPSGIPAPGIAVAVQVIRAEAPKILDERPKSE